MCNATNDDNAVDLLFIFWYFEGEKLELKDKCTLVNSTKDC